MAAAVAAAAMFVGCSGGDGDDNGTGLTPAIEVALSQAALSVVQGASQTVNVTLTRSGGFAGAVDITVEGAPTGATATAAPPSIAAGATSSVITITAGAATPTGNHNLTVRARGTGVTDKTQTLALTVTAPPAGSYTLSAAAVSVQQGGSGTSAITITRTNFTGAVTLALEGAPNGVTGTFNPNNTTTNASTLTLNVGAAVAAGTHNLTVRGTATGQADKTAALALTVTAAPSGSYTLAVTPTTVPIAAGANGTANVALTRTGGFTGAVALTVEGAPTGVTAAFNPASVTANASVLTLTVAANVAPGNYNLTIKGTATDQADKTAALTLTVTAASGYTLALNPATVPVQQGANGTTTVNINRTGGFTGAVALTVTGAPTGLTGTFNPASATGNTSTLTLAAAANAPVGNHTLTVRGNSGTLAEQTATLTVTVTQSTGGSGNTTFDFCTTADLPLWFAVQDGSGAWTRVTPTGTRFVFNIASGRGGVAWVDGGVTSPRAATAFATRMSGALEGALLVRNKLSALRAVSARRARASALADAFDLTIFYGTQAELNSQGACVPGTTGGKTVNGSVAGIAAQQTAYINLGPSSAAVTGGTGNTFELTDVPDGTLDLLASRVTTNISGTDISFVTDKIIIRRGLSPANNSTLPVLDFNNEGFAPVQANITVGNLGGDAAVVATTYFTAGASGAVLFNGFATGAGPFPYYGVPAAQQQPGDLHFAFIASAPQTPDPTTTRFIGVYFKDATNRTVNLGPQLTAPTVSVASTTPYVRLRAQGTLNTEYNKFLSITYEQGTTDVRSVFIDASAGYLNGAAYDLTIPDFSGVAGWDNNWGLKAGSPIEWSVFGIGFTGIGIDNPNPSEGSSIQAASRLGQITP